MQAPADPLSQLHDILLPEAIGWWPLAPGWWALLLLLLGLVAFMLYRQRRHHRRNRYRVQALAELAIIADTPDNSGFLQACSLLLRRTALTAQPHRFPVDIQGAGWLAWLDHHCPEVHAGFSTGAGQVLLSGLYQRQPTVDREALQSLVATWIRHHRNQWQTPSEAAPEGGQDA